MDTNKNDTTVNDYVQIFKQMEASKYYIFSQNGSMALHNWNSKSVKAN